MSQILYSKASNCRINKIPIKSISMAPSNLTWMGNNKWLGIPFGFDSCHCLGLVYACVHFRIFLTDQFDREDLQRVHGDGYHGLGLEKGYPWSPDAMILGIEALNERPSLKWVCYELDVFGYGPSCILNDSPSPVLRGVAECLARPNRYPRHHRPLRGNLRI